MYSCILCHKARQGRFTRRQGQAGRGWSQGHDLPAWYCFTCLPPGQGRDEDAQTVSDETTGANMRMPKVVIGQSPNLTSAKGEADEALDAYKPLHHELQTVKQLSFTPANYQHADVLLGRIRERRKAWGVVWTRIQEKTIKPLRAGLDELYKLNRDVDGPYAALEEGTKAWMTGYKTEEVRQLQESARAKAEENRRLQEEIEEKARQEQAARTDKMREKLAAAREQLKQEQADLAGTSVDDHVVRGVASTTRTQPAWRIVEPEKLLIAIGTGKVSLRAVEFNRVYINQMFKAEPEVVASWPGVEIFDEIKVVGR